MNTADTSTVRSSPDPSGDGGAAPGDAGPSRRPRPPVDWLWIAIATVVGWPVTSHVPFRNLDRSWQYAMSAIHGIDAGFGDPVVFNYGPLGFVASPMVGTGAPFFVASALLLVLVAGTSSLLYAALRLRAVTPMVAGPATAVVMLVAPTDQPVELCVLAGIVYVVVRTASATAAPFTSVEWWTMGAVVVALTMIKVSVGPALAVALVLTAAAAGRRAFAHAVGAAVVSTCAIWLVTGQSLGDLLDWLGGVAQVSIGHVSAMSKSDPDRNWQYATMTVVVVGAIIIAAPAVRGVLRDRQRDERLAVVAAVVISAFLAWFLFRQGFTRHASRSRMTFLSAIWMMAVLVPWRRLVPSARVAGGCIVTVALASFFVADGRSVVTMLDPTEPVAEFARSAAYAVDGPRRDTVERSARDAARADYAIPQQMLDRVGSASVHVDGTEIVATWAFDLSWAPMPSLQRYLGYTTDLDGRNAAWLESDDAPDFVLREFGGTIDGRLPTAESPAFQVALFCRYEPVDASPGWQLLERTRDRCGEPVEVVSQRVAAGEIVTVPEVDPDAALLVAYAPDRSLADVAASTIFKPLGHPTLTIDGQPWRVLPGTSATPALIGVPDGSPWSWQVGIEPTRPDQLSVDRPGHLRLLVLTLDRTP